MKCLCCIGFQLQGSLFLKYSTSFPSISAASSPSPWCASLLIFFHSPVPLDEFIPFHGLRTATHMLEDMPLAHVTIHGHNLETAKTDSCFLFKSTESNNDLGQLAGLKRLAMLNYVYNYNYAV